MNSMQLTYKDDSVKTTEWALRWLETFWGSATAKVAQRILSSPQRLFFTDMTGQVMTRFPEFRYAVHFVRHKETLAKIPRTSPRRAFR